MIFQHISTDDIITELDSDFENLSTMSSPVLSSISSVSTSCNDGKDNSTMLETETSVPESNDHGEEVELLPPLHSFVPVIEMLPGLHLEDNTYYAITPLIRGDLKTFISYACRIEELVLTDVGRDEHPRVSQDVITLLCLIQDINAPFLSSLKRLRLINVDSELSFLWLCVTPSLEALDISHIPPARQSTIAAFLSELVGSIPRLAHLTLGCGQLSPSALQASVRFTHLRTLRINVCGLRTTDAAAALDFTFLAAVAALPELALFDIDARTYTAYIPYADSAAAGDCVADMSTGAAFGEVLEPFRSLKTMTIAGNVLLMHDLLHDLLPRGIEHVSLTLVCNGILPIPAHWNPAASVSTELTVEADPTVEATENVLDAPAPLVSPLAELPSALPVEVVVESSFPEVPFHTFEDYWANTYICKGDRSDDNICPNCMDKRRIRHELQQKRRSKLELKRVRKQRKLEQQRLLAEQVEKQRLEEQRLRDAEKSNIHFQITHFASVIERVVDDASLQSVRIDLLSPSMSGAETALLDPPRFPSATLCNLLACPSLTKLEIENWALTCVSDDLLDSTSPLESPPLLQILRLPLEDTLNSGVALSALSSIARLYPHLLHFQTRIVQCASPFLRELKQSVTDHGLKELAFGGESPVTMEDMLKITPYICLLFPHLEQIITHDGHDAEGWKSVHELVKMCQHVRDTDKMNFHRGA